MNPMLEIQEGGYPRYRCDQCGFVQYLNPASAAGVLVVDGGRVLLVKRKYDPYRGLWVIPSGFIEYSEDIRGTAVREVEEETGLTVRLEGLHAVESCFDDPRGNAVLVVFDGHVTGGEMRAGDDAEDVDFFPLDRLPEIAFEAHRKILGALSNS